jgi:hypothetical protein
MKLVVIVFSAILAGITILHIISNANSPVMVGLLEDNENLKKVEVVIKCYESSNKKLFCVSSQRQLIEKVVKEERLYEYGNTTG